MLEINKLGEGIDFNNLTYYYTSKTAPKYFVRFKSHLIIHNDIKNGRISLQKEEKIQEEFRLELNEILKGNLNYESKDQINIIKILKKLYNVGEKVYNLCNDYTRMVWYLVLNKNQFMEKGSKYYLHGKIQKSQLRTINSKYQLQHGMKNLNYLMDHILYQIVKITLNTY